MNLKRNSDRNDTGTGDPICWRTMIPFGFVPAFLANGKFLVFRSLRSWYWGSNRLDDPDTATDYRLMFDQNQAPVALMVMMMIMEMKWTIKI